MRVALLDCCGLFLLILLFNSSRSNQLASSVLLPSAALPWSCPSGCWAGGEAQTWVQELQDAFG